MDSWLSKEPSLPVRLDRERLWNVVRECRAAGGYLVESLDPVGQRLHTLMAGVATHDLPPEVRELLGEMVSSLGERVYLGRDISSDDEHPVSLIAAPTYDARGGIRPLCSLCMWVGRSRARDRAPRRGAGCGGGCGDGGSWWQESGSRSVTSDCRSLTFG